MAPKAAKPVYVKPVHTLTSSSTRVAEQIKGRVLFVHTERHKSGSGKVIAVMVDKDAKFALKSVLVHEAWAPADQVRLQKTFKPLEGKVVSITNAKIVPKGKSIVFFDTAIKSAFDQHTNVAECPEDDEYPHTLPPMPNLKSMSSLAHACMVSLVAAVTEEGQAVKRWLKPGYTIMKPVANLKMATGSTIVAAAFWEGLAEKMSAATVGQVYKVDWVLIKQDSVGKYSLVSVAATTVELQEGEAATAVQNDLAEPSKMVSMSTVYGQTHADKMKQQFAQADLYSLEEIQALQLNGPSVVMIPACHVLEARGMTAEMPNRAWYTGCTQCKKQLESAGDKMRCSTHGDNKGKKIYGGQLTLSDPSHKKELTVWEDMLRRLVTLFLGHEDLDVETVMEDLCQALKGIELVVRVGLCAKKDGSPVSFDLFDVVEQVNGEGCLSIYKSIVHHFGPGLPGTLPACCRHVTVNDLGQLTLKSGDAERLAETVKLMVRVVEKGDLKVSDGIDGIEVCLKCECICCKKECKLVAAGHPSTVQSYTRIGAGEHLMAFVQTTESDEAYKFPVGYYSSLKDRADVDMDKCVHKWQANQVIDSMAIGDVPTETDEKAVQQKRTQSMDALLKLERSAPKRLKMQRTDDGKIFF